MTGPPPGGWMDDPAPLDDLPTDFQFEMFLASLDPKVIVRQHGHDLTYPERSYLEYLLRRGRNNAR